MNILQICWAEIISAATIHLTATNQCWKTTSTSICHTKVWKCAF